MPPKKTTGLTFGEATNRAKAGEAVARESWSKYEMFAYIIPTVGRTPYCEVEKKLMASGLTGVNPIEVKEHWGLFTVNQQVIPWNPYGSDVLANDWKVYEIKPKELDNGNS